MDLSRRQVLTGATAAIGAALVSSADLAAAQTPRPAAARTRPADEPFGYCLNTSTIRGNNLDIVGVVTAASKAGFHAVEPWIQELDAYTAKGGSLKDLGKRIKLLEKQMLEHARSLEFEKAARVRDQLALLREQAFGSAGHDTNVVPAPAAARRT